MNALILILIFICSYLIGSINTAIVVGRIVSGDDIRNHGSGNAGATNVLRTYGKVCAAFVVIGDCLKSVISCLIAMLVAKVTPLGYENVKLAIYAAALGSAVGHNYPVFFNFRGGKGILVSITAYYFADWKIALLVTIIGLALIVITKYVSLGSVVGAILFIIFAFIFKLDDLPYIIFAILLSGLAIYRHRSNIKRLIKGEESKITDKKKKAETTSKQ